MTDVFLNEKKWIIQGKHSTFQNERECYIFVFPVKTENSSVCLLPCDTLGTNIIFMLSW
jgi:hypothetical protein